MDSTINLILDFTFLFNYPYSFPFLQMLMAMQEVYFKQFETLATPKQIAFYRQIMTDPVVNEVQRMRDIALLKGGGIRS